MRTVLVRYKTTPEHAETNAALVRAVYDELRAQKPKGFRYATYRMPDAVSFVHLATHTAPDAAVLTSLAAFKTFQSQLKERCVEPPVVTELAVVDAYDGLG